MTTTLRICLALPLLLGSLLGCEGGASFSGSDDPSYGAPGPSEVVIDTERRTTRGDIALGNLDGQISEMRRLLGVRGPDGSLERMLAGRLLMRASYTGSYDDFDEVDALTAADVSRMSDDPGAWTLRASYLSAVHRFEEAREALDEAERLGAGEDTLARSRLIVGLALGDDPVALEEAARARREAFPNFQSVADHASTLAAAGRFDEADQAYIDALAMYRDVSPFQYAWTAFQRGVMWGERADRPDLAVPLYREAVRRLPQYVVANVHLAELESEDDHAAAVARLRVLADTVGDPEPGGLLSELLVDDDPAEAARLAARSSERYDTLLSRHRQAFLDHGSEFFSGPGADPARGLALAQENVALRRTPRSYKVAIEAAMAAGDEGLACELGVEAEPLRDRHPVLDGLIRATCER